MAKKSEIPKTWQEYGTHGDLCHFVGTVEDKDKGTIIVSKRFLPGRKRWHFEATEKWLWEHKQGLGQPK